MSSGTAAQDRIKRIFTENFSVGDIAEPLVSFDATADAATVLEVMQRHGYEVVGVRRKGLVAGYIRREDLADGPCGDYLCEFDDAEVVPESACFPTLVRRLTDARRLFVTAFGQIGGIVTRTDLQKPLVRMWLFGMITIVEMGLTRLIESRFPEDGWKCHVTPGRLEKAEALLAERKRRNRELDLLDCLQLADKGRITIRDEALREQVGYQSRRRGEETIKSLEALRNNLAHSQDILSCDWDTIVRLVENLDKVFAVRTAS